MGGKRGDDEPWQLGEKKGGLLSKQKSYSYSRKGPPIVFEEVVGGTTGLKKM